MKDRVYPILFSVAFLVFGFGAYHFIAKSFYPTEHPASRALAEDSDDLWQRLKDHIQSNHIKSIHDLVYNPPDFMAEGVPNFVFESRSIQGADPEHPRVLLTSPLGTMTYAYGTSPSLPRHDQLEVILFRRNLSPKHFELREIDFSGSTPVFSDANPPLCLNCHRQNPKPIFDNYNTWPGVYGSTLAGSMSPTERQNFETLIAQSVKDGPASLVAPYFSDKAPPMYPSNSWKDLLDRPNGAMIPNPDPSRLLASWAPDYDPARPAKSLSRISLALNFERVFSQLENLADFDRIIPGILAMGQCQASQIDSLFPKEKLDDFHRSLALLQKLQQTNQDNYLHVKEQRLGSAGLVFYKDNESGETLYSNESDPGPVLEISFVQWLLSQITDNVVTDDWFVAFETDPVIWDSNNRPLDYLQADLLDLWKKKDPGLVIDLSVSDKCTPLATLSQAKLQGIPTRAPIISSDHERLVVHGKDVLRTRCLSCHLTDDAVGGKLPFMDESPLAQALHGGLYDEIQDRISSTDPKHRMPYGRPELLPEEKSAISAYLDSVRN